MKKLSMIMSILIIICFFSGCNTTPKIDVNTYQKQIETVGGFQSILVEKISDITPVNNDLVFVDEQTDMLPITPSLYFMFTKQINSDLLTQSSFEFSYVDAPAEAANTFELIAKDYIKTYCPNMTTDEINKAFKEVGISDKNGQTTEPKTFKNGNVTFSFRINETMKSLSTTVIQPPSTTGSKE